MMFYRNIFLEELIYIFRQWIWREYALVPFVKHGFRLVSLTKCYSNQPGFYLALERTISQILISDVWTYHIFHEICRFAVSKMDSRHLWQSRVRERHLRVDEFIFREWTWDLTRAFKNREHMIFISLFVFQSVQGILSVGRSGRLTTVRGKDRELQNWEATDYLRTLGGQMGLFSFSDPWLNQTLVICLLPHGSSWNSVMLLFTVSLHTAKYDHYFLHRLP